MVNENLKIKGKIEIINKRTGEVLYEGDNLVVNTGLSLLMDRLKDNTADYFTHIAVGTDNTPVTATDTALGAEISRKAITDMTAGVGTLTVSAEWLDGEALAHWYECGIFNNDPGGIMFNRIVIDFEKTSQDAVEVKFTITITT